VADRFEDQKKVTPPLGHWQKNFWGGGNGKNTEKRPNNSTIKPLPGGSNGKRSKIEKKKRKLVLLSLYLLYLYHV